MKLKKIKTLIICNLGKLYDFIKPRSDFAYMWYKTIDYLCMLE